MLSKNEKTLDEALGAGLNGAEKKLTDKICHF